MTEFNPKTHHPVDALITYVAFWVDREYISQVDEIIRRYPEYRLRCRHGEKHSFRYMLRSAIREGAISFLNILDREGIPYDDITMQGQY